MSAPYIANRQPAAQQFTEALADYRRTGGPLAFADLRDLAADIIAGDL